MRTFGQRSFSHRFGGAGGGKSQPAASARDPTVDRAGRPGWEQEVTEGRENARRTSGQDHGIHRMGGCCSRALLPGDVVGSEQSQPAASARDPTVDRAGRPGWEQKVTEGREKQPEDWTGSRDPQDGWMLQQGVITGGCRWRRTIPTRSVSKGSHRGSCRQTGMGTEGNRGKGEAAGKVDRIKGSTGWVDAAAGRYYRGIV